MTRSVALASGICLFALAACSANLLRFGSTAPTANKGREIIDTQLAFDLSAMTADARITIGPSDTPGASLESGDLLIDTVSVANHALPFSVIGAALTLGLPASDEPIAVDIGYHWHMHDWNGRDGFSARRIAGTPTSGPTTVAICFLVTRIPPTARHSRSLYAVCLQAKPRSTPPPFPLRRRPTRLRGASILIRSCRWARHRLGPMSLPGVVPMSSR